MNVNTYTTREERSNSIGNSNQPNNYWALVEKKFIQLEPNDWRKFQKQLKKTILSWNISSRKTNKTKITNNKERDQKSNTKIKIINEEKNILEIYRSNTNHSWKKHKISNKIKVL